MAQETIIGQANEFVENTLEHARKSLDELPKKTRKQFDDLNLDVASASKRVGETAQSAWETARQQVRHSPGAALGIGALIGFALGFFVRGRD
jgi:ElaB/YqjD/DUF883 family membrane-anchored ribosome-binding protein